MIRYAQRIPTPMIEQREYIRTRKDSVIRKIVIDRDLCIAAASCLAVAPETYDLDEENKAVVIDPDAPSDETLIAAAESCPTHAILLFDADGNRLFPK